MKCFVEFLSKEHMDVPCRGERMQSHFKYTLTAQHIQAFKYVQLLAHKRQAYDLLH